MPIHREELHNLGFVQTHEITAPADALPEFVRTRESSGNHSSLTNASVYIWLSPKAQTTDGYDVLYVGKAGYGTVRRFSQHRGGFRNAAPGTNCARIRETIAEGRTILVYAKVAEEIAIFDVEISRYSAEEEALCKRFSPLWNRATFPGLIAATQHVGQDPAQTVAASVYQNVPDDDTALWLQELDPARREQFSQILRYAEGEAFLREMSQKKIRGFTGQPRGYNRIPMIIYGIFNNVGNVIPHRWFLRIPMPSKDATRLTVFIPECFRALNGNNALITPLRTDRYQFFEPVDLDIFLRNPKNYVDWARQDTRR